MGLEGGMNPNAHWNLLTGPGSIIRLETPAHALLADLRLLGPKMPTPMLLGRTEEKSPLNKEKDGFIAK